MLAGETVRVVAASLKDGDEVPMAEVYTAVPHFFVRVTAICVERRELGALREFILRAMGSGFSALIDIAGFLGMRTVEVQAELNAMSAEFFVATSNDTPPKFSLMEKGRVAISRNGLPQVAVREVGCYVNGVTRRIEQVSGELVSRKKLPAGTLILPAIPARAPRIAELDVLGVKVALLSTRSMLSRSLEIARLGRIMRTASLYLPAHLLLRRGMHSVPMICVNGAVDSDLARLLGAHPALQGLKAVMERSEKQVRHNLLQIRPSLKTRNLTEQTTLRHALNRFVAFSDAGEQQRAVAEREFTQAAEALVKTDHWIGGTEREVLLAWAVMSAKKHLLIVAPPLSSLLQWDLFDDLRAAVRRGVKIEVHVSTNEARAINQDESARAALNGILIVEMVAVSAWCGFCCDQAFVVAGSSMGSNSPMGRCEAFFGVLLSNEPNLQQLLRDVAITSGVPVLKKKKTRIGNRGDMSNM